MAVTGTVAVVGAGLIGRAWGMIFARAGWSVRLWDPAEGVAGAAAGLCAEGLRDMAAHGLCDDPGGAASRIVAADTLEGCLEGAGFIQENGPEVLEVKRALFARLDAAASADAIIASSSSAIRCSLFTEALPGRARCLIGHPVNPPHLIPLVELSGAEWTDPAVIAQARAVYEAIGQVPVTVLKEIEGFVLNRLQGALLAEAFHLVSEGYVTPQDLDRTVSDGLGLRWSFMGPFETIELNAPGGLPDYCERFTGFYKRLARRRRPACMTRPLRTPSCGSGRRRRTSRPGCAGATGAWRPFAHTSVRRKIEPQRWLRCRGLPLAGKQPRGKDAQLPDRRHRRGRDRPRGGRGRH